MLIMKQKKNKIKLYSFAKLQEKYMKDPEYKKAYEELELEYSLIEAIIKARGSQGLTQRELAQRLKIAQSSLARFEAGRANPTMAFVKKLISGLNLKVVVSPRV